MTQIVTPAIHTVHFNYFEAGEQAFKVINQLLNDKQTELNIKIPVVTN